MIYVSSKCVSRHGFLPCAWTSCKYRYYIRLHTKYTRCCSYGLAQISRLSWLGWQNTYSLDHATFFCDDTRVLNARANCLTWLPAILVTVMSLYIYGIITLTKMAGSCVNLLARSSLSLHKVSFKSCVQSRSSIKINENVCRHPHRYSLQVCTHANEINKHVICLLHSRMPVRAPWMFVHLQGFVRKCIHER